MALVDEITYSAPLCRRCGQHPCRIGRPICLACTNQRIQQQQDAIMRREQEDGMRYAQTPP
jgi:hypothetical protein